MSIAVNMARCSASANPPLPPMNNQLQPGQTPEPFSGQEKRQCPGTLHEQHAGKLFPAYFPHVYHQRRIADVLKREPLRPADQQVWKEINGDDQSGQNFNQKIFGANEPQNRLKVNGTGANEEIDGRKNDKGKEQRKQERSKAQQGSGSLHRIDQQDHSSRRYSEHQQSKQGFAHGLGNMHPLITYRPGQFPGNVSLLNVIGNFPVNIVVIERADNPANRDVGDHLREAESLNHLIPAVDRFPDEIIDRNVNQVGDDAGEVSQPVSQNLQKGNAGEGEVGGQRGRHSIPPRL